MSNKKPFYLTRETGRFAIKNVFEDIMIVKVFEKIFNYYVKGEEKWKSFSVEVSVYSLDDLPITILGNDLFKTSEGILYKRINEK
jgi:hypothetical protein